jgi:hypothetical protein
MTRGSTIFGAMNWEGNLRKLTIREEDGGSLAYSLRGKDRLEDLPEWPLNEAIGKDIRIFFEGQIHCVATGKRISKTYGEGYSFDAWRKAPETVESVIRPELSRIHEGIALRDREWEEAHHNQPHWLYLSQTSGWKVGVTRSASGVVRWLDQGAVCAAAVFQVPYRQLAGEMEVLLKSHMADKTNWRAMLSEVAPQPEVFMEMRERVLERLGPHYATWAIADPLVHTFQYPVRSYPLKVTSVSLDKVPDLRGKLMGFKGQYAIFEDGRVINIRSHAGYRVTWSWKD